MVSYASIGMISLFQWYLSWPVNDSIRFRSVSPLDRDSIWKESVYRVMYWFMSVNRFFINKLLES